LIFNFWECLSFSKPINYYEDGLKISNGIDHLRRIYYEAEKNDNKLEIRLYLQMASFYKLVLFKSNECFDEIQKCKSALNSKSIQRQSGEMDSASEKGIILGKLDLYKPMEISYINKVGTKLTGYDHKSITGFKIEIFMPNTIAESH
jgi:hypothetical protein